MSNRPRYTAGQVAAALRASRGLALQAAGRLGCDAETIHRYARRHPSVAQAMAEARGELVDLAESKLEQALDRGDWPAVHFTLRTLGKDRGYGERTELTGAGGQELTFTISLDRPTDDASD